LSGSGVGSCVGQQPTPLAGRLRRKRECASVTHRVLCVRRSSV